jgi:drug/metabolite transporter (DMT)-like permease
MAGLRIQWSGVLVVVTAASLFGTLGVLSRAAYAEGLAPFAWVAWRAGVGALGLWAVTLLRRGLGPAVAGLRRSTSPERFSLALATIAGAVLNLAIFVAFQRTAIALALLGFYTYPAMVAVASVALGHERLDRERGLALLLAIGGMAAVVLGGLESSMADKVDALGIGLALVAAVSQATFVLASRGYAAIPTEQAMGSILVGSAIISIGVAIVADGPASLAMPFGAPSLLALLVLVGLGAAALPSFLFLTGIRRLGPVRTGILMLFEPVVGVVLAAIVLGEAFTPVQAAGGATILAAAFIVQRRAAEQPVAAPVVPSPGGP